MHTQKQASTLSLHGGASKIRTLGRAKQRQPSTCRWVAPQRQARLSLECRSAPVRKAPACDTVRLFQRPKCAPRHRRHPSKAVGRYPHRRPRKKATRASMPLDTCPQDGTVEGLERGWSGSHLCGCSVGHEAELLIEEHLGRPRRRCGSVPNVIISVCSMQRVGG